MLADSANAPTAAEGTEVSVHSEFLGAVAACAMPESHAAAPGLGQGEHWIRPLLAQKLLTFIHEPAFP